MAQGAITARTQFIDEDGNVIGTSEAPLSVESEALRSAVDELTEAVRELRDVILLTNA